MTKPIGQSFYVSEPPAPYGVDGVFVKRVDIFFQRVSPTFGIELQIRSTDNGLPTTQRMPFATKYLPAANTVADSTAATPTSFFFDTPVFLPSNKQYALVLVPAGGCPDYLVWTAQLSGTDVTTNNPIYDNNSTGDLFTSSNDLTWEPIYNEDMKFTIYIANFTSLSGTALFKSSQEEWITYTDQIGSFIPRERVYIGNTVVQTATIAISGVSGTFNVGDTIYQGNSASVSTGIIYFANSTYLKVANANGAFANSSNAATLIYDANTSANATANIVSQYVNTAISSNIITLPDASRFANADQIYVMANNRGTVQVVQVTQVNTTSISNNFLTVNTNILFNDSAAQVGKLMANGALRGGFTGGIKTPTSSIYSMVLDNSTANSTVNFGNIQFANCILIGSVSGASGWLRTIYNPSYDTITPHFLTQIYSNTTMGWSYNGIHSDGSYTYDSAAVPLQNGQINSMFDFKRLLMSRSNEFSQQAGGRIGLPSLVVASAMTSSNTKVSPVIDNIRKTVTFTSNFLRNENELFGYKASYKITSANSKISKGDTVTSTSWGNTATATVLASNSATIVLNNVNGKFTNTTFTTTGGVSGYFNAVWEYGEAYSNTSAVLNETSRYISKNVILAANQDSEDIITYLTAYRPNGTNVLVYAKILSSADNEPLAQKRWSRLPESTLPQVFSSSVNIDDQVELTYGFPTSIQLANSGVNAVTSSTTVTVPSSSALANNSFVYFYDPGSTKAFNVRKVIYVTNSTSIIVDRAPSANMTSASLGIIPNLEHVSGAFLFDQNNNIVRYATQGDMVFDRYIQFAIKIVPVGNNSLIVPRIADVRTLAMMT